MHAVFPYVYRKNDAVARFALMEKEGNGAGHAQGQRDIAALRQRANVFVAVGKNITTNSFDRWLKERSSVVDHAKGNRVHTNEEKMLLIRGDQHSGTDRDWEPQKLITTDRWTADYIKPGSPGAIKRLLFSGQ
jgi:hypothetical protein